MAKPKLCLIPSAIGDKLYSVLPSDGSGDFDFTRATTATRVNKDGLIETVASGDARLNYPMIDGKVVGCPSHLLEPQRTNLLTYSEDFTQWSLAGGSSISSNQSISPNGTLNADNVSSGEVYVNGLGISGNTYTFSCYYKGNAGETFIQNVYDGSNHNRFTRTFNGKWQRFSITVTLTNSGIFYLVDDRTGGNSSSFSVWGAQLEQGSYATSYIPTNGSAATRNADTGVPSNKGIQTGDISSYVDGSNGVFYFEGSFADFNVVNRITLSNSTGGFGGDYISIATNNSGSTEENKRTEIVVFYKIETPLSTGVEKAIVNDVRDNFKMAISWDGTTLKGYANGVEFFSNSETAFGGFDRIYFSRADNNIAGVFHGKQKDLRVYDTALNDTDLEELTSWTSFNEMAQAQLYKTY